MIGAFYQPLKVIADLDTLDTLPDREISAGLAEVIKYGPIADDDFMGWIEKNIDALRARDKAALAHAIQRSCEIKAWVVGQDERESGFGYGEWLHGEAVGCGMVMAADLSARCGLIDAAYAARIAALIERAGLPIRGPILGAARYLELMRIDKKSESGQIRFVLIDAPGRASMHRADDALVAQVIADHTA